ncbi:hypothetical protein GCM10009733_082520 [Nonomuraea maheshkhaliensis]|uniref:Ankyrin repeat domain-containing protein n=1 Tax=Nonomuraea maheshkhaliensis TaxID=419590 RepID=A0ABP4SIX8_9ACTN
MNTVNSPVPATDAPMPRRTPVPATDAPAPRRTPSYPPDEASSRRRILRYAVPRWMIERATERRLAGDWRGACAAANVDVAFDLAGIANEHGGAVAAAVEDDLLHFAPDLLRWHLPRVLGGGWTTIRNFQTVTLGAAGEEHCLRVTTPATWERPQRLRLRFERIAGSGGYRSGTHDWATLRHLWDVRHTGELLERHGGGDRPPFFDADGTLRPAGKLPTADPGPADPPAHTEWVTLLHERGEVEAAFAAVGIELDPAPLQSRYAGLIDPLRVLEKLPVAPARLEPELRLLIRAGFGHRFQIDHPSPGVLLLEGGEQADGLRIRLGGKEFRDAPTLPEACWRRLPDLDVLRQGDADPDWLHPLVRDALFPLRADPAGPIGPPDPWLPSPVRVRCRGEWHELSFQDGALRMPHSAEEQQREQALRAFGGKIAGCFAVERAMRSEEAFRLPKALRELRRELFMRVQHGDTPGVLRLLDAGVDPRLRDGRDRTLLHALIHLDHEVLLPRLLAAGLDLEAVDYKERTPLYVAVVDDGSPALIRALLAAGANPHVADERDVSISELLTDELDRTDLDFLLTLLEQDEPAG